MGSISNYGALERYQNLNGERLKKEYKSYLLGRKVVSMSGIECNYYVQSRITLDNNDSYEVHYRWASEEENDCNKEILEENEISMREYYEKNILNNTITAIDIGYERDDMLYCYAICYLYNSINKNIIERNVLCEMKLY